MHPQELTRAKRLLFEAFQQVGKDSINMLRNDQVLPLLCSVAVKQGANQQHILDMLHNVEEWTQNADTLRIVARCLIALGEVEEACQLWMRIVNTNPSNANEQEFSDLLRYVAIRAYNRGNNRYAARRLRESARWTNNEQQKKVMEGLANFLDLQIASNRLLTTQFFENKVTPHELGRYHVISRFIETYPQLKRVLLAGYDSGFVKYEWKQAIELHRDDYHLFHVLAVIYREHALASLLNKTHEQSLFVISTAIWTLLLSSESFWPYFSHKRRADKQGNRVDLTEWQKEVLWRDALESIFSLHINHAIRAFAEGNTYNVRLHLHCLNLCQQGLTVLQRTLQTYGITFSLNLSQTKAEVAAKLAGKLLNEWYLSLIHNAEKQMQEQIPPPGLRKSYRVGINSLQSFIKVSASSKQILITCLKWYNEFYSDLWSQKKYWQVANLIIEGDSIAKLLIPLAERGKGYKPENQALSEYFVWRYFITNQEDEIAELKRAIEWNPSNTFAQNTLTKIQPQTIDGDDCLDEDEEDGYSYEDEDFSDTPAEWENFF